MLQIQSPFQQLFDTNGSPLDDGYVYIGMANANPETSPIAIYWDDAGTIPAAQPLRTMNGYLVRSGTPARVYTALEDFSMTVKDRQGRVVFSVLDATSDSNLTTALASSSGSSLVGFLQAGANAQLRTVQSKLRDVVSVKDFGAVGNGIADDTLAIQAAIDYAYTFIITQTVFDEYGWQSRGGATVNIPPGKYLISSSLVLRPNVSLKGAGKSSTCIYSTINAPFFTAAAATKSGEYNPAGISVYDLMVLGNKTGANQAAFDLLRPVGMKFNGVVINSVGGNGMVLREVSNSTFVDVEIANCGNCGLIIVHGDSVSFPSNANTFISPRIMFNDGDGVYLVGGANGNTFIGGSVERNGYATVGVGKYNIKDESQNFQPNHFIDVWTEGPCEAHIYCNSTGTLRITGWRHFGDGSAVLPNRALIVEQGVVYCHNPIGSATSYKTISGSNAPFRVKKAGGLALLNLTDASGSTVSGLGYVEDETGAKTGLYNQLRQSNSGVHYGPQIFYNDNGAGDVIEGRADNASDSWFRFSTFFKHLIFGSGSAAPDAGIERKSANVLGMLAGDSFQVGGVAGETLRFNAGTSNGAVATTLGSVGPTGSTAGNPQGWLRVNVNGTDRFVPYW